MKNKCGSTVITTPIIIALGMLMVSILIILAVNIITPFLWYEKLSSATIKYVYIMEEYGYMTSKEAEMLKKELVEEGFDKNKISLNYTNNRVSYGETIYLNLSYMYELKIPLMKSQFINMNINRTSVSKI